MYIHYHFLTSVLLVTSKRFFNGTNQSSPPGRWHSSPQMAILLFPKSLRHFLTCRNLITSTLTENFYRRNLFRPYKPNHAINSFADKFPMSLLCTSTCRLNSIWLLCHLLHVTTTTIAASKGKTKMLDWHKSTGLRTILTEHPTGRSKNTEETYASSRKQQKIHRGSCITASGLSNGEG
jgi:hypothetical protein